ncbi:VWA domain-containing protein, partial [Conexibacter sp. CPCC 205706]
MSLLAPWWLAGLLALVPLLALHLRRRRRQLEVDSLMLWREQAGTLPARRRARLVPSLLLVLQVLIVLLLVAALARPTSGGGTPAAGAAPAVFVLDDSAAMATRDVAPDRLTAARRQLDARLARLPAATPVTIVLAAATPRLLVSAVSPADAREALAGVRPRAATRASGTGAAARADADTGAPTATTPRADLRPALALAAGQLHRRGGAITLFHSRGTTPPPVRADGVTYAAVAIGTASPDDVALTDASARCAPAAPADASPAAPDPAPGASPAPACTVFAAVRNDGTSTVRERLAIERDGRETAARELTVAGGERVELSFAARAGERLTLRLTRADALAADDAATVTVPGAAVPTNVTLVSDRPATAALARALAATPGVTLRVVAPGVYQGDAAARADLVVFDRWLPDGGLPDAQALLLVAPPRLPGGSVGAPLADPVLSGLDGADPLLAGVDLDGLALAAGAARGTVLPQSLRAIAWAPGGPLLATGAEPGERPAQTTLMTFDPAASTLPQLAAFPALLANVVAAAQPAAATPAAPGAGPSPADALNAGAPGGSAAPNADGLAGSAAPAPDAAG